VAASAQFGNRRERARSEEEGEITEQTEDGSKESAARLCIAGVEGIKW